MNLLPELDDRRGEVGGLKGDPETLIPTQGVLHALWCVPAVVAVGPGKLLLEGLEQVVCGPGQDNNVVHIQQGHDDDGCVANACGQGKQNGHGSEKRHIHLGGTAVPRLWTKVENSHRGRNDWMKNRTCE